MNILNSKILFTSAFKRLPTKGNLAWEYNPFRNYRLSNYCFEYKGHLYTYNDLESRFNITAINSDNTIILESEIQNYIENNTSEIRWKLGNKILTAGEAPIYHKAGELVDFETSELSFSLNHPVQIQPQWSYDGSVNLILNDGYNIPRLINSRFSPLGKNTYQIVDRKGDNDSNIYTQGEKFDIETSLHKKTNLIPKLEFYGTYNGGSLSVGNYFFYFKYSDADGNETDFIAESGLVSVFIGNMPYNINSGFRNQNSHKGVQFMLYNIDSAYQYVYVYYTKVTSEIQQNAVTNAYKIEQKFIVNSANQCKINITGLEQISEVSLSDINLQYQTFNSVETQAECQNRIFFSNIRSQDIDYKELTDISLHLIPSIDLLDYDVSKKVSSDYTIQSEYNNSYYNPEFIYKYTGYFPNEIYRFGIVYILKDGTLSPVFNVRGKDLSKDTTVETWKSTYVFSNGNRAYIEYDEYGYIDKNNNYENAKGVIKFPEYSRNTYQIYGIKFKFDFIQDDEEKNQINFIDYLKSLGIKGYFFVRQKRIPTILCQAYTIGVDRESHTPVIPYKTENGIKYIAEGFLGKDKVLTHDYGSHVLELSSVDVDSAAICPEYDVNPEYYNTLFSGDEFCISETRMQPGVFTKESYNERSYICTEASGDGNSQSFYQVDIQAVEDNTKLVAIDDTFYSARAGEAEEAFRYEYIKMKIINQDSVNLVRGSYGPYLGIKGTKLQAKLINIYIPGYSPFNLESYFLIRFNDESPFYAISDRYEIDDFKSIEQKCFYRGDCYICQFTHRINRNFQDPSSPTNDQIVDPNCWRDHYTVEDGVVKTEEFDEINLGDVNAVMLGQWVTFPVRSTINLNIRSLDDSIPDEQAIFGHPRVFCPYAPMSAKGIYKTPEALCHNKALSRSLSERYNFKQPEVPAIKNDFTNRISYSEIHVNDAFKNGFREFKGTSYRDYPKTYGQITKIIELRGNLICVFEHGVALIPVNERAVAAQGSGGNAYINTSNILPENPNILSDKFGSQWKESVIKTPKAIYGVDTIAKKIWRTNGQVFECISDFKVQEFLNQNITLTERENTPIIGIRNVKTHFNKFKNDVMFTFYDNLYGFEEKVWNLCWNENLEQWITFYSWVPSYSENIYNQFFSFNRDTSKWIAKLGISSKDNDFSDGVVLSRVVIPNNIVPDSNNVYSIATLGYKGLELGNMRVTFSLERDNYQNYKHFSIIETDKSFELKYTGNIHELFYEMYERTIIEEGKEVSKTLDDFKTNSGEFDSTNWFNSIVLAGAEASKDDRGRKIMLPTTKGNQIVFLLNIQVHLEEPKEIETSLEEAFYTGLTNLTYVDKGVFQYTVAITTEWNMQFLTTDFWKHGQAGIIDIADKINPTYWYGKQHPFEFEFVVVDNPSTHKIFDNLQIISNNAEPESFHYEIVGDVYDFAKDKKNMYIRQEATKEFYQYNGTDIIYNHNYPNLTEQHRLLSNSSNLYDKSTLLPLYYSRQDTINEVEDSYHLKKDKESLRDFANMSGGEVMYYETLDEYRIWNHAKAVDLNTEGRLRGNMQYNEDKWLVQINPINIRETNESDWSLGDLLGRSTSSNKIPIEIGQAPIPDEVLEKENITKEDIPENSKDRAIVIWDKVKDQSVKVKDKWMKVRIRYTGNKLAVITAVQTLFSISYS